MSRGFGFWLNFKGLPHQATICKRSVFNALDAFDSNFKICMDYDFFLRAYRQGYNAKTVDYVISVMRDTGVSLASDIKALTERLREEREVHYRNANSNFIRFLYDLWWFFTLCISSKNHYLEVN